MRKVMNCMAIRYVLRRASRLRAQGKIRVRVIQRHALFLFFFFYIYIYIFRAH